MSVSQITNTTGRTINRFAVTGGVILFAVYLIVNLLGIGGTDFVVNLNNNLANLLALGVMTLAVLLWRRFSSGSQNRALWTGLAIGWIFWVIAEFWWAIAVLLGQELPYPSWADFFWLIGYIPMYTALIIRIQSLPKKLKARQLSSIWLTSLLVIAITVIFVLIPTIQSNDPARLLESILNILYPVVDLVLLILVLLIFFSYQSGRYGRAWIWLSIGFILHSFSNLLFSYAVGIDLYYPDGALNLISTVGIDVPYTISYLFWLVGLYQIYQMRTMYHPYHETEPIFSLVPNTHISISTKRDDTIIDVSRNFTSVFTAEKIEGRTLPELVGLNEQTARQIFADLKEKAILSERRIEISTASGNQEALISGLAVINPQAEYAGALVLLRLLAPVDTADDLMTDFQKGVYRSLASKTGVAAIREADTLRLLDTYYLTYIRALYNEVLSDGGAVIADALIAHIRAIAEQNNWQIEIHPHTLLKISPRSVSEARSVYPALLETIKKFVVNIFDERTVSTIMTKVDAKIDPAVHRNASYLVRSEF